MLAFSWEDAHSGALPSLPEWALHAVYTIHTLSNIVQAQRWYSVEVDGGSSTKAHPGKGKAHPLLPEVWMEHGQG